MTTGSIFLRMAIPLNRNPWRGKLKALSFGTGLPCHLYHACHTLARRRQEYHMDEDDPNPKP